MVLPEPLRVGYVVKRYPRYSETFVMREILAHEAAGLPITIFALRPPNDTHFQELLARVRAPVHYLPSERVRAADLWHAFEEARAVVPELWQALEAAQAEEVRDIQWSYDGGPAGRPVRGGPLHLHRPCQGHLPCECAARRAAPEAHRGGGSDHGERVQSGLSAADVWGGGSAGAADLQWARSGAVSV
jgi:hypothetical protein